MKDILTDLDHGKDNQINQEIVGNGRGTCQDILRTYTCLSDYQMYARLTRRRAETTAPSGTRRLANTRSESLARASIHHRYFLTDGASEKDLIASGRMTARPSSQRDPQDIPRIPKRKVVLPF